MMTYPQLQALSIRPRRVFFLTALSAWVTFCAGIALPLSAQTPPPDAAAVAAQVQSFYDQTTSVQARFNQTYFHKLYNRYDRSPGSVVFKRPGMMRWDYESGKTMASNGQHLLVYEPPAEGESEGQGFEHAMSEDQLPDAFAFLTGTARLETLFTFRLLDAAREGFPDGHVLELRARTPSPHYERLLFYVRTGDLAGVVQRVLIIDAAGNRNRFDFSQLRFNREVPNSRFDFHFPPHTRRINP